MNELSINVKNASEEQVNSLIEQYNNDHAVKIGFKFAVPFLDDESGILTIKFYGKTESENKNSGFGGIKLSYEQKMIQDQLNSYPA